MTESLYFHPLSHGRRGVWSGAEPAPTIRGVQRPMPSTYSPHERDAAVLSRGATIAECGMLQGFPGGFEWPTAKGAAFLQIGNAVPPPLAETVLKELWT